MFMWLSGFQTAMFFWNLEDENFGWAFLNMICAITCLYIADNHGFI